MMMRYLQRVAIVALALIFAASGLAKLIAPAMFEEQFAQFGLPRWFIFLTATVELLGAALIAVFSDARQRFGAAILAITMAVATSMHLIHDPLPLAAPALVLLALTGTLAFAPMHKRTKEATRVV